MGKTFKIKAKILELIEKLIGSLIPPQLQPVRVKNNPRRNRR